MKKLFTCTFHDRPNECSRRAIPGFPGILCILLVIVLGSCSSGTQQDDTSNEPQQEQNQERTAKATMEPASGSNVSGEVTFTARDNGKVHIELKVENLPPGEHAVHLHENGDCSAADASSAGGHWNPTMKPHGKRGDGTAFHKGDIDNMKVGDDGKGTLTMTVDGWSIGGPDSTNIVGKSVIIHEKADDFTSQPSGNAGGRISCGVIKEG